jgi:hypothetical protein
VGEKGSWILEERELRIAKNRKRLRELLPPAASCDDALPLPLAPKAPRPKPRKKAQATRGAGEKRSSGRLASLPAVSYAGRPRLWRRRRHGRKPSP